MAIQPYLYFDGRCEEAAAFYQRVLGAEVLMQMRFSESPDQSAVTDQNRDKIMHMSLQIAGSEIMASDGRCTGAPHFAGFALSLPVASPAEAERTFAALSEGGEVQMPLTQTFYAERFGMLADRFGVSWMVLVQTKR